jgi:hypothetical protein
MSREKGRGQCEPVVRYGPPKSEARKPKAEGNPKPEGRKRNTDPDISGVAAVTAEHGTDNLEEGSGMAGKFGRGVNREVAKGSVKREAGSVNYRLTR